MANPKGVLTAARVSRILGASEEEVDSCVFKTLDSECKLDIMVTVLSYSSFLCLTCISQTALEAIAFLRMSKSPRADEYRAACDTKFELSTAFKPLAQLAALQKQAVVQDITASDLDKVEVALDVLHLG